MNILLVDDDASIRTALTRFLSARGHDLHTACNGREALEHVESGTPDLILCDIHMPEMDGLTFLLAMRKLFPAVPVVVMTGDGNPNTKIAAYQNGACKYLAKPIQHLELQACIEDIRRQDRSDM